MITLSQLPSMKKNLGQQDYFMFGLLAFVVLALLLMLLAYVYSLDTRTTMLRRDILKDVSQDY